VFSLFRRSFADQDTDHYVPEVLAVDLRRKMVSRDESMQWTDVVALTMVELYERGITRDQIEGALRAVPVHPAMIRAVQALKAAAKPKTTLICLSNANIVFITTILKYHGLEDLFEEIITNPADWTEDGLLRVRRRIGPDQRQHACKIGCSPNMCKGDELDAYLARSGKSFDRLVYVGDGDNDFCPVLRFKSATDIVCVRRDRGLERRIRDEGRTAGLKASLRPWTGAWEVEEIFATLHE